MIVSFIDYWIGRVILGLIVILSFVLYAVIYMLLTSTGIKYLYYLAMLFISTYIIYGGVLVGYDKMGIDTYLAGSVVNIYYGYHYSLLI